MVLALWSENSHPLFHILSQLHNFSGTFQGRKCSNNTFLFEANEMELEGAHLHPGKQTLSPLCCPTEGWQWRWSLVKLNEHLKIYLPTLGSPCPCCDPPWGNMALRVMHDPKIWILLGFAKGRRQSYITHLQLHYFVNHYFELIPKWNLTLFFGILCTPGGDSAHFPVSSVGYRNPGRVFLSPT